jgi:YHS domain-containing protein
MFRGLYSFLMLAGLGLGVLLAGCSPTPGKSSPKTTPSSGAAPQKPAAMPKSAEPKQAETGMAGMPEGLAELPAADRALAEKQKVCPVSGQQLGSMGKPVKVTVKGKTFFLCCEACKEDLNKDPDKYLAKLSTAGQK